MSLSNPVVEHRAGPGLAILVELDVVGLRLGPRRRHSVKRSARVSKTPICCPILGEPEASLASICARRGAERGVGDREEREGAGLAVDAPDVLVEKSVKYTLFFESR